MVKNVITLILNLRKQINCLSYRITVSTIDFGSIGLGLIPSKTTKFYKLKTFKLWQLQT